MIRGTVKNKKTGSPMPYCNVYFSDQEGRTLLGVQIGAGGTTTDSMGKYALDNRNREEEFLTCSHIGFKTQTIPMAGDFVDKIINFEMEPQATTLGEVNIIAKAPGFFKKYKYELMAFAILVFAIIYVKIRH